MKRPAARVLLLVVLLILYGSLFPWHFVRSPFPLHHRWDAAAGSYLVHDVVVNIALYIPLGLVAGFVFATPFGPVLLGLVLSSIVEFTQIYVPGRHPTVIDILGNTAGAGTGYALWVLMRSIPEEWLPQRVGKWAPWTFLAAVAAVRILPLHFVSAAGDFEWLPFGLLLEGNAQSGLMVLAVKALCFTGAIWLFRLSGWKSVRAAVVVTGAAALMECVRIYAPAARPGVTDPVIAAFGGFLVANLYPETETRSRSAE